MLGARANDCHQLNCGVQEIQCKRDSVTAFRRRALLLPHLPPIQLEVDSKSLHISMELGNAHSEPTAHPRPHTRCSCTLPSCTTSSTCSILYVYCFMMGTASEFVCVFSVFAVAKTFCTPQDASAVGGPVILFWTQEQRVKTVRHTQDICLHCPIDSISHPRDVLSVVNIYIHFVEHIHSVSLCLGAQIAEAASSLQCCTSGARGVDGRAIMTTTTEAHFRREIAEGSQSTDPFISTFLF